MDEPARLPEGASVKVEVLESEDEPSNQGCEDLNTVLLRHAGKGRDLPTDPATNHHHYAHGKPKR